VGENLRFGLVVYCVNVSLVSPVRSQLTSLHSPQHVKLFDSSLDEPNHVLCLRDIFLENAWCWLTKTQNVIDIEAVREMSVSLYPVSRPFGCLAFDKPAVRPR
jgi:hypothetical protein